MSILLHPFRVAVALLLVAPLVRPASAQREERVVPNDNRVAAGALHDGVLVLHLELRTGRWYPDGDMGNGEVMQMFAVAGQAPQNPGPSSALPPEPRSAPRFGIPFEIRR